MKNLSLLGKTYLRRFCFLFKDEEWVVFVHNYEDYLTISCYLKSQKVEIILTNVCHRNRYIRCIQIPRKEILFWIRANTENHYNVVFHREVNCNADWSILKPADRII